MSVVWEGIRNAFLMAWQVWWALVLGFAISAVVQARVPRERVQRALGGEGTRAISLACALGAASSSCSYAAVAIAKSLFEKGASAASTLAFQFASTNLVFELGIVVWALIGWQFTLAEFLGGLVMIIAMSLLLRLFITPRLERQARARARRVDAGHDHHHGHDGASRAGGAQGRRGGVRSLEAWRSVAANFRHDWSMLWKEISAGFLLAGFIGQLPASFFSALFVTHAPHAARTLENVLVAPIIAALSFVCSVGNVPLAAVLWAGGISFGGVIAFLFADLIVLPIALIYRKYYGADFALRVVALMFTTIVLAALVIEGLFGAAGLIPHVRPTHATLFPAIALDYTLVANSLALPVFVGMFALSLPQGTSTILPRTWRRASSS